jgi:ribosomal protein S12 methylthiotransferase accessory factor
MHWGVELTDRNVNLAPLGPPNLWLGRAAAKPASSLGTLTGSAVGFDREETRLRAFAELVEHVAAFVSGTEPDRTRRASAAGLWDAGEAATAPGSYAMTPNINPRIDPVDDHTPISWVRGVDLCSLHSTWVPALVAHLCWKPPPGEALFARPSATGLAAHTDATACVQHALLEVLERDACGLSWRIPGWPVHPIELDIVNEQLLESAAGFELELYEVGDPDFAVSSVIALVHLGDGAQLSVGSACRLDVRAAANAAVVEALMVRWTLAHFGDVVDTDRPETSLEHVVRAYRRGDEVVRWYRDRTRRQQRTIVSGGELVPHVARVLGSPVIAVDVCDRRGRESGWQVVRVVVPGAYPRESDGRLMKISGPRLENALARYAAGAALHVAPHPFG